MVRKKKKKKAIKIEETPNYIVEDFKNPSKKDVVAYRRKKVDDHVLTLAILKKKGPRGGRTKITSILHPKKERKSNNPAVTKALRKKKAKKKREKTK